MPRATGAAGIPQNCVARGRRHGPVLGLSMKTPATCGEGVAEYAPLPEKVAATFEAMAGTLAHHRKALDLQDPAAREEDQSYAKLIDELHDVVTRLRSVEAR